MWKSDNKIAIALLLIILLSLSINVVGIWWGLPSFSGWAADEVVPMRVFKGIDKVFSNGWHYKYPPFHFYVLAILYLPFWALYKLNFLDIYSLPVYTILFYLGRFLSLILSAALLIVIYLCGREVFDRKSALFAVIISALSSPFIYYAKTTNLEIPYLFWAMLSFLFYLRILKYQKLQDYLLFSTTAAIAVCTKDQAYGFYILTPVFLIWQHHRHLTKTTKVRPRTKVAATQTPAKPGFVRLALPLKVAFRSLRHKNIVLSLAVGIGTFVLLQNLIFNWEGFSKHVQLIVSGDARIVPSYQQNIFGQLQILARSFTHIRFSMGWPLYAVCLLGFVRIISNFKKYTLFAALLIPFVSYYLFFIGALWFNPVRYLMPWAIAFALAGGKALAELLNPARQFFKAKVILAIAILIYTVAYGFSINLLMVQDSRYTVEAWIERNIEPAASVLGVGDAKYLPRLDSLNAKIVRKPSLKPFSPQSPDYIITTSPYDRRRFEENTPEYEFFSQLDAGKYGKNNYRLTLDYQASPLWSFFNSKELYYRNREKRYVYSNFDKINPEIKVFKRE